MNTRRLRDSAMSHNLARPKRRVQSLQPQGEQCGVHPPTYEPLGLESTDSDRLPAMEHIALGRSGLRVSRLCLGTMTFGYQCDEAQSFAILDEAFDSGITFLDAADHYPIGDERARGRTEQIIGNWMRDRGRRDDVVLGTKFALPMGSNPWDRGGSRRHVMDAIDNSLRRLGTDYVDVYQMHFPDDHTPIEETLQALDDCVKQGKVRYLGCSNFSAWQLARANGAASTLGLHRFEVIQPRYNLLFRAYERDLFDLCALDDIAVTPYRTAGRHAVRPGVGRSAIHEALLERARVRDNHRAIGDRLGRRNRDGRALHRLGPGEPGRDLADHRGEQARAARSSVSRARDRPR